MNQSQDNLWNPATGSRTKRPLLGWLSHIGTGLLSALEPSAAGGGGGYCAQPAPTEPPFNPSKVPIPECCSLWYNINEDPSKMCHYPDNNVPAYTCPDGFQPEYWTCVEGTRIAACAECAAGDSCWAGPWQCSIWWWVS